MRDFQWQLARSVRQAAASVNGTTEEAMIAPEGQAAGRWAALVKAGGVDLLDMMKDGLVEPERLVDISRLPGLNDIVEEGDGSVRIGALATLARVALHPDVLRRDPDRLRDLLEAEDSEVVVEGGVQIAQLAITEFDR